MKCGSLSQDVGLTLGPVLEGTSASLPIDVHG
jgi:hypothetical protein